jgi:hypothetical protein
MEGKEDTMSGSPSAGLSGAALFAERDARRRRDREAEEQLQRRKEEEIAEYRKRLDNFQLTDVIIKSGLDRIKRAFERGETELMMASFPSSFCTDGGRAIINAGAPPINKMSKEELARRTDEPEWLGTLPAGARLVHRYWKDNLRAGGFKFEARIINYPGGMPGDVGLFFAWPKESLEG